MERKFRADHVGSLIRPDRLMEARERRARGELAVEALRELEDACIREIVSKQEEIGLRAVTDGEFRRSSWSRDFLTGFDNVQVSEGKLDIHFRNADGTLSEIKPNGMAVTGKIKRSRPIQLGDFLFVRSVTSRVPKVCIPSPTMMHFRGGRYEIDETAYPDLEEFFEDLAAAYREELGELARGGMRYLQIDDVNFAYLCDPTFRDAVRGIDEDPDLLPARYVRLINDCIADLPADVTVFIHICRGNASSAGAASGGYEPLAETLFGGLDVDGFFLEYDDERSGDFAPLRFVPKKKSVVLGLVTTKRAALEPKDDLKRRIEEASNYISVDQLAISPQCGFSSGARDDRTNKRQRGLSIDVQWRKLDRVVETAVEVWGSV